MSPDAVSGETMKARPAGDSPCRPPIVPMKEATPAKPGASTWDLEMIARAGITYARFYSNIPLVFPTKASVSAPLWNKVDFQFQQIGVTTGMHILLQMLQSPPWLVPTSGACHTSGAAAMPTDVNAWANLAALYVAHLHQKFPTLSIDYEIWNEPNTGAFCSPTGNPSAVLPVGTLPAGRPTSVTRNAGAIQSM